MSASQTFRIFVSSPSDAHFERQRVDRVVARLNGELGGTARLTTVRWETEFYKADSTFQAQIPASVECNIVLAIFRARLGTELPSEFARMPDGDPYPSGSAYEVLTAIAKRRAGGDLPDVFVFRCSEPPLVRIDDRDSEEGVRSNWNRLTSFFSRWFLTDDGHFRAAFQTFGSTDDFEAQIDRLLRNWLRDRLAKGGLVAWPIATHGSPYPGLQAFGPRHAPVFYGRARDTSRAVEAWTEVGRGGSPFLLVVGASGAGKSSLVRAGLVPRLTTPGVVPAVDLWRVATMRPGESPSGPIVALAHALLGDDAGARGRDDGLPPVPELAHGDYATPADLAALLAHADAAAVKPILGVLDKIGEAERRAQASERPMRCDLVLVVDQLDELFSGAIDARARSGFATLLEALLATRRIWIVATLRADLYESFLKDETLMRLKSEGATYDLAAPILADFAEAVRGPARAAELDWETDAATGERLDDRLIGDIDRTDLLPIVQFVLDQLFQQRVSRNGRLTMTHEAYMRMGTLDGAIDTAAEAALASLDTSSAAALPRLLRSLVVLATMPGGTRPVPTLRQAPRSTAAYDKASLALVKALTDARILISGRDPAGTPVVALAHQRVVEAWGRARDAIAQSADLIRVREDVEAARQRWENAGRRNDMLIAKGLPLSEAEHVAAALENELPPDSVAFVARSGRAARLRYRLVAAAAVLFFAIAVGAGILGVLARFERDRAEAATAEAKAQRNGAEAARVLAEQQRAMAEMARKIAVAQRRQAEMRRQQAVMRLAVADEMMDATGKSEQLRQCLHSTERVYVAPPPAASRDVFVGRWHVEQGVGLSTDMEWHSDGTCAEHAIFKFSEARALDLKKDACTWDYQPVGKEEFVIDLRSSLLDDDFMKRLHFRIISPNHLVNVVNGVEALKVVCPAQELALARAKLAEVQAGADAAPGDLDRQHAVANELQRIGDMERQQGSDGAALDDLRKAQVIRTNLAIAKPDDVVWRWENAHGYILLAQTRLATKDEASGLEDVAAARAILARLRTMQPGNNLYTGNMAFADELAGHLRLAGNLDRAEMLDDLRSAIVLGRQAAEAQPAQGSGWLTLVNYLYELSKVSGAAEKRSAIVEAIAVLEKLERENRTPAGARGWLVQLRQILDRMPAAASAEHHP